MVLEYRVPDPALPAGHDSQHGVWLLVLSSVAMLLLAAQFAGNGAALDAKWRTNEQKHGLTAIVTFDNKGRAWPVAWMLHNTENYWTTRILVEAVQRNLPCLDIGCEDAFHCRLHPRGGFMLTRSCDSDRPKFKFMMCDKLRSQVNALRQNSFGGLFVLLCQFHVIKASALCTALRAVLCCAHRACHTSHAPCSRSAVRPHMS